MQYHHDMRIGVLTPKISDFIEQFILGGLGNTSFVVNSAPVLYS
jgi:hypothetical protein